MKFKVFIRSAALNPGVNDGVKCKPPQYVPLPKKPRALARGVLKGFISLCLLSFPAFFAGRLCADAPMEPKEFFTHDRFVFHREDVVKVPVNRKGQEDLGVFVDRMNAGLSLFGDGDYAGAIKYFGGASRIWPEYFGCDFLTALAYEKAGDIRLGARFYKSYLIKLENFRNGKYAMSMQMLSVISSERLETYEYAEDNIRKHLFTGYGGMDLDKVRPVVRVEEFIIYLLSLAAFIALYYYVFGVLVPHFKRLHRANHPPEGFWVCRKCWAGNPTLSNECLECGRIRVPK
ncbi:MAG: hypothetical protein HQL30_04975 [Candidatus Omnitrophica bacterium]|nr:hypothetical protein [Candidatus Omnitrophota bacterium]